MIKKDELHTLDKGFRRGGTAQGQSLEEVVREG
jgi:hypothetical protein